MRKGNYLVVRQENLLDYLKKHPEDWNATKVTNDSLFYGLPWYKEKLKNDKEESYYWTEYEMAQLRLLRYQGYSIREIAEQMNRSESSVKYKLYRNKEEQK